MTNYISWPRNFLPKKNAQIEIVTLIEKMAKAYNAICKNKINANYQIFNGEYKEKILLEKSEADIIIKELGIDKSEFYKASIKDKFIELDAASFLGIQIRDDNNDLSIIFLNEISVSGNTYDTKGLMVDVYSELNTKKYPVLKNYSKLISTPVYSYRWFYPYHIIYLLDWMGHFYSVKMEYFINDNHITNSIFLIYNREAIPKNEIRIKEMLFWQISEMLLEITLNNNMDVLINSSINRKEIHQQLKFILPSYRLSEDELWFNNLAKEWQHAIKLNYLIYLHSKDNKNSDPIENIYYELIDDNYYQDLLILNYDEINSVFYRLKYFFYPYKIEDLSLLKELKSLTKIHLPENDKTEINEILKNNCQK